MKLQQVFAKAVPAIALLGLLATTQAQASVITLSTANSTAAAQNSAAAYESVVQAAVATHGNGYGSTTIATFNNVDNHGLFTSGSNQNIAFDYTIDFNVAKAEAGTWEFRFGVDFGHGGAVFLDSTALGYKNNDMWWNGSYSNASQSFDYTAALGAGNHELHVFGLENCCDGGEQGQFRVANTNSFVTFASTDGINPVRNADTTVPEPASLALLGLGLGMLGFAALKRRKQ